MDSPLSNMIWSFFPGGSPQIAHFPMAPPLFCSQPVGWIVLGRRNQAQDPTIPLKMPELPAVLCRAQEPGSPQELTQPSCLKAPELSQSREMSVIPLPGGHTCTFKRGFLVDGFCKDLSDGSVWFKDFS